MRTVVGFSDILIFCISNTYAFGMALEYHFGKRKQLLEPPWHLLEKPTVFFTQLFYNLKEQSK
jgi:hypothetical protein